ncbi:MAG: hypothetical protein J5647_05335 [Spirochaetaceae bacterium]|nr:hypothetical protein [Spirochaetaceae bacterium]
MVHISRKMKKLITLLLLIVFLIFPMFAQETGIIDYPHTLQEFYEKLDEAFPDDTDITTMTFDDWSYFKSGCYRKVIFKWVDYDKNTVFLNNINPKGYQLKDTSYMFILLECYWDYKNGKDFDFDTRFKKQEAIDFPPPPDYPHTLQEFYEKLDAKFPEYSTDIVNLTLANFINKYYWSNLGSCISDYIDFKENAEFLSNINPNGYRVHKESYRSLLMGSYWSHITGKDYDLDLHFECDDRCSRSHDLPEEFPLSDLVIDASYSSFSYEYKGLLMYEYIYFYRRPSDPTDSNIYIYSYHFGWIKLTIKEYVNIRKAQNQDKDKIIWDYFQTKEKLVF